jgi:hypothetical protein
MLDSHREHATHELRQLRWPSLRLGTREGVEYVHTARLDRVACVQQDDRQAGVDQSSRCRNASGTGAYDYVFHTPEYGRNSTP